MEKKIFAKFIHSVLTASLEKLMQSYASVLRTNMYNQVDLNEGHTVGL